jgi:ATP phosphoribosyltransferase regulatory subunit
LRDILPTEASELHTIELRLTETSAAYGYVPIEPPLPERIATHQQQDRLIQFLDRDGSLVALRPDLTRAVARLVAQRYREMSGGGCGSSTSPRFFARSPG